MTVQLFILVYLQLMISQANVLEDGWDFYLYGMKEQREKLNSGSFIAHGTKTVAFTKDAPAEVGEVAIFCAFQENPDRFRFDIAEPNIGWKKEPKFAEPPKTIGKHHLKLIARDNVLHCYNGEFRRVETHKLNAIPGSVYLRGFDIRCCGLLYWPSFVEHRDLDRVFSSFQKTKPNTLQKDNNGIVTVAWSGRDLRRRELIINETEAFTPIHFAVTSEKPSELKEWVGKPYLWNDVTWKLNQGQYVPATFTIGMRNPLMKEGKIVDFSTTVFDLAITWQDIDTPIDPKYFEIEDFRLDRGVYVADFRSSKPVVKRVVGIEIPTEDIGEGGGSRIGKILTVVTLIALLSVSCFFAIRKLTTH